MSRSSSTRADCNPIAQVGRPGAPGRRRRHRALTFTFLAGLLSGVAAAGVIEEPVAFTTHDGLTLEGIVSYPDGGGGPFPGVLLLAGSGLQDADVTIDVPVLDITRGRQKHFRALARYLSKRGWTVLRYNKRGATFDHVADDPGLLNAATLGDLVEDARRAFATLLAHPRTAASQLVVYGHSEGTMVASRLARSEPRADLVVLVGSVGGRFGDILRYQVVERNVVFFELAADADADGRLTAAELDSLDGNHGLGSVYVYNTAEVLYDAVRHPDGTVDVRGINPTTDTNGDGRLDIALEIEPVLRSDVEAFIQLGRSGALGAYLRSLLRAVPVRSFVDDLGVPVLLAHGELDVQTPLAEALDLATRLEAESEPYDVVLFDTLGHSLSRPNDFFAGDGGLTVLDNLTLNVMKKHVRRRILQHMQALLAVD